MRAAGSPCPGSEPLLPPSLPHPGPSRPPPSLLPPCLHSSTPGHKGTGRQGTREAPGDSFPLGRDRRGPVGAVSVACEPHTRRTRLGQGLRPCGVGPAQCVRGACPVTRVRSRGCSGTPAGALCSWAPSPPLAGEQRPAEGGNPKKVVRKSPAGGSEDGQRAGGRTDADRASIVKSLHSGCLHFVYENV